MIADRICDVMSNIERCAALAGRDPGSITLVAVTKTKPVTMIREAYDAGLRVFGENRVQEYLEKKDELPADVKWNLIGRLQTNKVKYIINNIWMLHSLDRIALAEEIQKQCEKKDCTIDALLQVNVAGEDSKTGFFPEEVMSAAEEISKMKRIHVSGLMTIAPYTDDKDVLRKIFAQTKKLYDKIADEKFEGFDFKVLSMGMTNDYCEAVLEGANMLRIGSAIFGDRD
jgi:pyridoxal phosphate enzyme (YggS family)